MPACRRALRAAPTRSTGMAVGDNLLLAANYAWNATATARRSRSFVNTIAPPAPVTKATGPRDVELQPAAGGKAFRIQVQYRVRTACKSPVRRARSPRAAHPHRPAPLRVPAAAGRRQAGPRDAREARAAEGKKGKIRFYIAVSKSQLLKAPFRTEGGSRVAETRLRVWYTPKGATGAVGARRPHQGLDRAHQVRRAARAHRHPVDTRARATASIAVARAYPGEP